MLSRQYRTIAAALVLALVAGDFASASAAIIPRNNHQDNHRQDNKRPDNHGRNDHNNDHRNDHRDNRRSDNHWRGPVHRGPAYVVAPNRVRVYRNVRIVRPYGHWYMGYGPYHDDGAAYRFLAFTAITMALVNQLNEAQERSLEAAQVQATTAPIGQSIAWSNGGATGSVIATREGTSSTGRYCREFQQMVTIGGMSQQAYGTACQQPDGAWEIVSTGDGTN
jgi:Ni/Co efflux regulator RcnB